MNDQVPPRPSLNRYSADSAQLHPAGALPAACARRYRGRSVGITWSAGSSPARGTVL